MFKEYQVTIDTTRETRNPVVHVNTNDLQTVKFIINILNQGKSVDLTGSTVRIAIKKPDNKTVFQDCKITDATKGKCEVVLNTQAYIVPGPHYAEVMIYYTADKVSVSGRFIYGANQGILNDKTIKSANEWQSINQAISDAEGILTDLRKNGTGVDAQARTDITSLSSQLAQKASRKSNEAYGTRSRFSNVNEINLVNLKVADISSAENSNMPNSPYGNKEYVHPDIFYAPEGWNGYRYWMAINPYKDNSEAYENPCIYASHDALNWVTPPGVTNPLYPYPAGGTHYSDPCWILDKNGYTLHFINRKSGAGSDNIFYIISSDDGVNWSEQREIFRAQGRETMSPSIIWTGKLYYMYFVEHVTGRPANESYLLKRVESQDLLNWTNEVLCPYTGTSKRIWHIDIIEHGGGLIMAANDTGYNNIMLFKARDFQNFGLSSEEFLTRSVAGRGLYKPDILLYKEDSSINLMLHYNLMGDSSTGGLDWELKRVIVPLVAPRITALKTFAPELYYMENPTTYGGTIPTTLATANFHRDGNITTYSFRIDLGDITALPTGKTVCVSLPNIPKNNAYHTFFLEVIGSPTQLTSIYGYVDGSTGRLYLKRNRDAQSSDINVYTHKLAGITSIRGSVTYFN